MHVKPTSTLDGDIKGYPGLPRGVPTPFFFLDASIMILLNADDLHGSHYSCHESFGFFWTIHSYIRPMFVSHWSALQCEMVPVHLTHLMFRYIMRVNTGDINHNVLRRFLKNKKTLMKMTGVYGLEL